MPIPPGAGGPPGIPPIAPIPLIGPAKPPIGGAPGGGIPPTGGTPGVPIPRIGRPLPAGRAIPGPAAATPTPGGPPVGAVPSRADGSAGGGPSTERETIVTPRRIMRPRVRFSSDVVDCEAGALWVQS